MARRSSGMAHRESGSTATVAGRTARLATVLLGLALAGLTVLAPRMPGSTLTPPPLRQGEPYNQARGRLLQAGWRLQTVADPAGGCGAALPDSRCQRYPELGACSLTGLGLCRFRWRAPDGGSWAVITQGGELNGDPGLVQSWFREE